MAGSETKVSGAARLGTLVGHRLEIGADGEDNVVVAPQHRGSTLGANLPNRACHTFGKDERNQLSPRWLDNPLVPRSDPADRNGVLDRDTPTPFIGCVDGHLIPRTNKEVAHDGS